MTVRPGRIYVGQAGASSSGLLSAATLHSRIGGNHLGGNVRGSTLRSTLASVLLAPLALRLAGPQRLEAESEARLTAWMRRRLAIAVHAVDSGVGLADLERSVVAELRPPLNIGHVPAGPLRRRLGELRAVVRHGIDDLWTCAGPGARRLARHPRRVRSGLRRLPLRPPGAPPRVPGGPGRGPAAAAAGGRVRTDLRRPALRALLAAALRAQRRTVARLGAA